MSDKCSFCFKEFLECNFVIAQPERSGYLRQAYICDDCITVAAGVVVKAFLNKKDNKGLAEFRKKIKEELKSPRKQG